MLRFSGYIYGDDGFLREVGKPRQNVSLRHAMHTVSLVERAGHHHGRQKSVPFSRTREGSAARVGLVRRT